MKIAECAHPSRYSSVSVSGKIPTFFYGLPVVDIGVTQDSVSSVVKAGYKQDARLSPAPTNCYMCHYFGSVYTISSVIS